MLAANYDITIDRAAEYTFVLTIQNQAGAVIVAGTAAIIPAGTAVFYKAIIN